MTSDLAVTPPEHFKNRRSWLIAFGVIEIVIACFYLILIVIMALMFKSQSSQNLPEPPPMPVGLAMACVFLYASLASVFLTAGVGSIRRRNWARILMILFSIAWLPLGVLGTLFIALIGPRLVEQQVNMGPEAIRPIFVISMSYSLVFGILLPTVFLVFYSRKSVKATCLAREIGPTPDRRP